MSELKQKVVRRRERQEQVDTHIPQGEIDHDLDNSVQELVEDIDIVVNWKIRR